MSWKLKNLGSRAGWVKLALLILAGLTLANAGRAQKTFATAQVLSNGYGSFTFDNTNVTPDANCPNIAGFAPHAPLWYKWTPPQGAPPLGEVEMDTIGSVNDTNQTPLNTVLAVFTGASLATLNQVAANDNLFPINNSIPQINESGSGDYAVLGFTSIGYYAPYYGPSHLRFNAQAGVTYYIAVDSQPATSFLGYNLGAGPGKIVLHWAYKSSGVFRFATEDMDYTTGITTNNNSFAIGTNIVYARGGHLTGIPLYQCAQTESDYTVKYVPEGNSVLFTYYNYNAPGVLVNVTRVAGSTGRATVNYQTVNVASLTNFFSNPVLTNYWPLGVTNYLPVGDEAAAPYTNYIPVSGTLVFDDYEMSKTILIPILNSGNQAGDQMNRVFGVMLVDDGGVTSPALDLNEASDVAPPRVDPNFNLALVKILNVDADPYGPDLVQVITSNISGVINGVTNYAYLTNYPHAAWPTNPVINMQKCNLRIPEDVTDPNNPLGYTKVTLYARRSPNATNLTSVTVNWRINNFLGDDQDASEEWNNWFPLQPGSDYAVPTPATFSGQLMGTNSDFNAVQGQITFPANGIDSTLMPITFTVTNSTLTKFNRDFKIQIYTEKSINGQNVPQLTGMVGETTVTILFNDQHPPAGSVDELYNADFGDSMALLPTITETLPVGQEQPGVSGLVNSLLVLTNNETLIGGDFPSYTSFNTYNINSIALVETNGDLDQSFDPGSGPDNGPIYALALTPNNNFVVGGDFTSFNGSLCGYVVLLNASGSLVTNFNASASVRAIAVQPDGKILIGGDFTNVNNSARGYLARLNADGSLDTTFNPSNILTGSVYAIALQTSSSGAEQIVVGGDFGVSGQSYTRIARFTTNGVLDTSFSPLSGANHLVRALGAQPDGKVVVGGAFTYFNGVALNSLARLNPDGSLDTTNFFTGTGADDTVYSITLQPNGAMYVGGQFSKFNGTHRLGFTRLYANGTVDTTFMDTAYNQFAGLKKIYSDDTPAVYASGVQSDGNVMIGGTFYQVGGGQANPNVCNSLDRSLGITESFGDPNLWVEPKTRDGVRNRQGIARLIGGSTPGPGNISLSPPYSVNRSLTSQSEGLVRTNGMLGPVSANFSVQPGTAQSGVDYSYESTPPLFWVAWRYTISTITRLRSDGLFGGNGSLQDVFAPLSQADSLIKTNASVTVTIIKDPLTLGNLNATVQLANPAGADCFYLGGQNIPLGSALGQSSLPFTLIDDSKNSGSFGFVSPLYVATNVIASIEVVRSNGFYGTWTMQTYASNGTAVAGTDYQGLTNVTVSFSGTAVSNFFTVTNILNGLQSTNFVEKTVNLYLNTLKGPVDGNAVFGISNAVLRLINPYFQGYLTLSTNSYIGKESAGFISFVVNRVAGNNGALTVQCATLDGPTASSNLDYYGVTTNLSWISGDSSPRTVSIALTNNGTVAASKQFRVMLSNPTQNGTNQPGLFYAGSPGSITTATLTISNDNSYGAFQFSAPSYVVRENGGYATITVLRTGGIAAPISVTFYTSDGPNAVNKINYFGFTNTLNFAANQIATNVTVTVTNIGLREGTNAFYFNVHLTNAVNATMGLLSNAVVNILDANYYTWTPGSLDGTFSPAMNGDVLALALQTNGQILAGGAFTYVNGFPENSVARLNSNGTVDSSGFLNGQAGANGPVQALICQTDGRVVIGGAFTNVDGTVRNRIARLMTDGSLDTSFNAPGGASAPVYAVAEAFVNGARVIYVGGAFSSIAGGAVPNLARLYGGSTNSAGGSLDTSFATGSGPNNTVYAIAVYPTNSPFAGKLLVGGAFTNINGFTLGHIARMNGDGSVDTSFGLNWAGANDIVRAIAIQTDGRILVGGDFTNFNGTNLNRIARLNNDGSLDTNFTANVGVGANGSVQAIAVQADNRIVLGGQFTQASGVTRIRITRLLPTGAVDPTINFGDGANGPVDAVVIQPADQMLVIGGGFTQYEDQPAAYIARIYGDSVVGSGGFQFTSASYQADERSGQASITISRTGGTSGTNSDGSGSVSVQFSTISGGAAVPGVNYQPVTNVISFPPGEVFETATVPVIDDGVVTTNPLTVNLVITNIPPAVISGQNTATLTIINDESAVSFLNANDSVDKTVPGGLKTIDVVRLGSTNGTSSVNFLTTTNGTAVSNVDFYAVNTNITFNPGDTDVQIQIPILNDNIPGEGNKTVIFALTNVVNTLLYSPSNETLTIKDTVNAPGQLFFSATNYVVNEADGIAVITVLRTNGFSGNLSAIVTTVAGTGPGAAVPGLSYITTSNQVTIPDSITSGTFTVPLVQNNQLLGTVYFSVVMSLAPNQPAGAAVIAPTNAVVNIMDKNSGFLFAAATNTVSESASYAAVNVLRVGPTNSVTQVSYATADGTAVNGVNYQSQSGTLVFTNGETLRSIHVPLIYDPQVTGNLLFTIALSNPTPGTLIGVPGTNTVVVQDADAGLSFNSSTNSVKKNAGSVVITVVCSNPAIEPVIQYSNGVPVTIPLSVQFWTSNGTATAGIDYIGTSGTLVFTNNIGTNTFTIPIINNGLVTGNRAFTVGLSSPTPPGQVTSPSNQVVTIIDSNSGLSFSQPAYTVLKTGVAANINVFRTGFTDSVVFVNFLATNGTALAGIHYMPTNGTLMFTNGVTDLAFSVPIIDTTSVQPDETVLLELLDPINGFLVPPSAAILTIHDTSGSFVVPAGSALISETNAGAPNGIIDSNEMVTVLFAFRNAGGLDVTNMYATLLAGNGVTSPTTTNGTPTAKYGYLTADGHSVSMPYTFTAHGSNGQQITATFLLTNTVPVTKSLGTAVFGYTVGAWTTVVSNSAMITINDGTYASPYPSTVKISGLGGTLIKATITLTNLSHRTPEAIDALLVSPSQLNTLFMAHCGGQSAIQNITITFDDSTNFTALPHLTAITTIVNAVITNNPTAYQPVPPFP